jgi:ubiquinone/menaquinone biosynthesis C-methylase UbiE
MIELAHKHIDNSVELRVIDGYTMSELQDNYFNLAYAVLLFEHFPNKDVGLSLINETYRVLTPGGIFCLFIATTEKGTTEGTSWGGVHWTEPEIVLAFTDAGFQIVKTTADPHPNPLITSRVIIGRK